MAAIDLKYGKLIWLGTVYADPQEGICINGISYGNKKAATGELAYAQIMVDIIDYLTPAISRQRKKYMDVIRANNLETGKE